MEKLIKILHEGDYSCVVENFEEIFTFTGRGVSDLYDMIKNKPDFLQNARIADKIIGKGAAALMILGGVKDVYADVISLSALILLREAGIEADFGRVVPFIWNRDKTDWCLLEKICYEETSAKAILPLIEEFINNMKKKKAEIELKA
jgi:iron complex outermembrane receptor protein